MTLIAIVLIVTSAFIHAGWNLLSKSRHPSAVFFLIASATGGVLLAPVLLIHREIVLHEIPAQVWILLAATGLSMAVYYVSLAGAYRAGDMSVAYPLARSCSVILVVVATLVVGRADQLTAGCIVGIALVVGGCFFIPARQIRDLRLANYLNPTCGLALLASLGIAGYSMLDDEALRLLRGTRNIPLSTTMLTLIYACLEALACALWLGLYIALHPASRASLRTMPRVEQKHAAVAGVAIAVAYTMVLVSMAHVSNISYVMGLRQLGIPLGAMMGIVILKERAHKPKVAGMAIMCTGLVLVAVG